MSAGFVTHFDVIQIQLPAFSQQGNQLLCLRWAEA